MGVRYAKKDIYAEVEEEGGKVNRLVAVKGQPVPAVYASIVKDGDTTEDVDQARELAAERSVDVGTPRAAASTAQDAPAAPDPDAPEPIEGYDDLSADEIVELLDALDDEHVAAVKAYEASHKERKTILNYERSDGE